MSILTREKFDYRIFILRQALCEVLLECEIFFIMADGQVNFVLNHLLNEDRQLTINT